MKKNTWSIRLLVDEMFVPATQHIILKIVGFQNLKLQNQQIVAGRGGGETRLKICSGVK